MYPIILALLSAVLFGASTPIGKLLLENLPPFQLAGWLYLGAAIGVAPGIFFRRRKKTKYIKKDVKRLIGAIVFGGVVGPVLLLMGLQRTSATSVALWLNLESVATAVLGYLFFRDHLGRIGWVGVIGTVVASTLLLGQGGWPGLSALSFVAIACICWGLDNHWTALIEDITAEQSTFWKGLIAGAVNLSIGYFLESCCTNIFLVFNTIVVGAFTYGFSITLYIKSAQHLGATRSQMVFSSAPFWAVALSIPLLGEKVSYLQAVAAPLLIISLVLLFRDQHSHRHSHHCFFHQHAHKHDDAHHGYSNGHDHPIRENENTLHDHLHSHRSIIHSHPHWPDIHHRHKHK